MSTILYFENLKTLTQTLDNKMLAPSGMETKTEMKIIQTTIKKNGAHMIEKPKKEKKKEYNKVADI